MAKLSYVKGKTGKEKFDYFNSLQYDILLRRKKGIFYLIIPELPLIVANENLENAYKDLCEQKQRLINKMLDCDAEDEITLPRKTYRTRQMFDQLKIFICKILIICLLAGTTLLFSGIVIMNRAANISGVDIVKKIARNVVLEAQRFTNVPEDIKQMRIEKLRRLLEDFRPLIDEFRSSSSSSNSGEK